MRVLVDTCIIIDALQAREPFRESAEKIFLLAANNTIEAFITAKSAADIYYLIHRNTHSDKDTRKILSDIFTLFPPLDTKGIDCTKALSSEISDYEDAIMVATAIRDNLDCLVTRNQKDFSKSPTPVYSPDELILRVGGLA